MYLMLVEVGKHQHKRDAQVSFWCLVVTATGWWWAHAWAASNSTSARHFAKYFTCQYII